MVTAATSSVGTPKFVRKALHDLSRCHPRTDDAYQMSVDTLLQPLPKAIRTKKEQATGLRYMPCGLMFCPEARARLPFSSSVTDAMRDYFSNGVCSHEIGYMISELESHGVTLTALCDAAVESGWRRRTQGAKFRPLYLSKELLHPKMFEGGAFRGCAADCAALLSLLHFYVVRLLVETDRSVAKTTSFEALVEVCREITVLRSCVELISDPDKVLPLARKQEIHQVAFVAAYGEECVRPKHHHRMHLPRDILKLGFVPHCAPMEAKHRALKGGRIVDNQKCYVNAAADFQEGVLPRLLLADISQEDPWTYVLLGALHKASSHARSFFGDDSLQHSTTARGLIGSLHVGDVVIWKWPSRGACWNWSGRPLHRCTSLSDACGTLEPPSGVRRGV